MRVLTSEISESRDLHTDERTLVRWLLDHAPRDASVYLSQVDQIRVCSRCGCGCASLNFAIGDEGWPRKGAIKVVSDHDWVSVDGHQYGRLTLPRLPHAPQEPQPPHSMCSAFSFHCISSSFFFCKRIWW